MSRAAAGRRAAYAVLRAVTSGRGDLPDALARARERLPDHRDQALTASVAAGTLRWMGALDAVIEAFAGRSASRLDAEVLDILRLGAFQLLHLDRVPARAVIADSVELAREQRKSSAAGFVNALLRRIDRERDRLPLPRRPERASDESVLDYLSVTLSHPRWLVERWLRAHGFEAAEAWARFDNAPAPLTLRVNTLKASRTAVIERLAAHQVRVEPARFAPDALVVVSGHPLATPLAAEGWFFVQDEASQLVALAARAHPGERVLDACASPGGKTVAMAADMSDQGLVVAGDVRGRRVELLRQTVARSGARSVRVARLDAAAPPFAAVFDLVLLDAPCSGLGTVRRDPEIRWRRTPEELPRLAATQQTLLSAAAAAVRPGGRLVYATCSSEPEENHQVVETFLARHDEFAVEPVELERLEAGVAGSVLSSEGYLQTRPDRHGLEAFFAASLRRRGRARERRGRGVSATL
jgi:16S rRNA (cytosine967-C5)-methyltransferase